MAAVMDVYGLCAQLNQMKEGQEFFVPAQDLMRMSWNSFSYGGGTEGMLRAIRANLVGSNFGTFDLSISHEPAGLRVVRNPDGGPRTHDRDGEPVSPQPQPIPTPPPPSKWMPQRGSHRLWRVARLLRRNGIGNWAVLADEGGEMVWSSEDEAKTVADKLNEEGL